MNPFNFWPDSCRQCHPTPCPWISVFCAWGICLHESLKLKCVCVCACMHVHVHVRAWSLDNTHTHTHTDQTAALFRKLACSFQQGDSHGRDWHVQTWSYLPRTRRIQTSTTKEAQKKSLWKWNAVAKLQGLKMFLPCRHEPCTHTRWAA